MNDGEHEEIHRDLGAYVLGGLEPAERDRFERHLSGCTLCREELADLAVLPVLLSRLDEAAVATSPPAFEPIVERLAQQRRTERRRQWLLTAAAVIVTLVAATSLMVRPFDGGTGPGRAYASADGRVAATIEPRPWGMAVHISAEDLASETGYVAEAVAHDGHRAQIATWSDTGRPVEITGGCYLEASDVMRVEIIDPVDDTVLAVLTAG